MRHNIAFLSSDARLIERVQAAVSADATIMPVDPRQEDCESVIRGLVPHGILFDAGAAGSGAMLERLAHLRSQFADRPLIAIGDELSAQLVLAAFRAGADDFLDRDAPDSQIHGTIMTRLNGHAPASGQEAAVLVSVLGPTLSEEDSDLALNMAAVMADADPERRVLLVDLSLPSSPARTALELELGFSVGNAIRDMARLDRTFLDSALARDAGTGLRVIPLSDGDCKAELPAVKDLTLLLQVLRANFDVVVVYWGPFSRQAVRAGADPDHLFVCCNQRFSSVRNAKAFLAELRGGRHPADATLAIHQLDTVLVPSPTEVAEAAGARKTLVLRATWPQLAMAHNLGKPLALGETSHYSDALRTRLALDGLLPRHDGENTTTRLMHWLRRATG